MADVTAVSAAPAEPQVHKPSAGDERRPEASEGAAVLSAHKALAAAALAGVKYDKIAQVRQVPHCVSPTSASGAQALLL